jgi:hypothetical protein
VPQANRIELLVAAEPPGEHTAVVRFQVPLAGGQSFACFDRELARQSERLLAPVGGGHFRGSAIDGGEGERSGSAAEIEHPPRSHPQLAEHRPRLRIRDQPIEKQVGAEELRVVHVLRSREAAVPRQAERKPAHSRGDLTKLGRSQTGFRPASRSGRSDRS